MKKILVFFLLILSTFLLTGCGDEDSGGRSKKRSKDSNKIGDQYRGNVKMDIDCESIKYIKDISNDFSSFITTDGAVYLFSLYQKFSNETNCKRIESPAVMERYYNGYLVDIDDNLYYTPSYTDTKVNKASSYRSGLKGPAGYIHAGKDYDYSYYDRKYVYEDIYLKVDGKHIYSVYSESDLLKLDSDESIAYIIDSTVKTNKNIYVYDDKIPNQEECQKYADVSCENVAQFYKVDSLFYGEGVSDMSKFFDDIKFYKVVPHTNEYKRNYDTFIVSKDGQVFVNYNY